MDVSAQLAALADPTRRLILEALSKHPRSVAELAIHFPVSRPAVSQHLKVLQDASLVRDRSRGSRGAADIPGRLVDAGAGWAGTLQALAREAQRRYTGKSKL
jgi:DNA-binding transcriptional ArsR family regulator